MLQDSFQWPTFLDTPPSEHVYERSRFVVIPVPYDGTASFRTGARYGPAAIIQASRHLEDFDVALGFDASEQGIFTFLEATPDLSGPEQLVAQVRETVAGVVRDGKIPVVLGGEHTVSIGAVRACAERYGDLSVLFMDAHGDLRDSYMGTRWGHASVARRISESCGIVEVGVRSISKDEHDYARANGVPVFYWPPAGGDLNALIPSVCEKLSQRVYVSIDLDVLDPSIMPSVGTPEPGGLGWWEATSPACGGRATLGSGRVRHSRAQPGRRAGRQRSDGGAARVQVDGVHRVWGALRMLPQ